MRPRLFAEPFLVGCTRDHRNEPATEYHEPIRDAERFITRIVDRGLEQIGMYVTDQEYEDLVGNCLELLLRLEKKYDPDLNPSFAGYAAYILPLRFIDLAPRALLGRAGGRIAERSHEELDERAAQGSRHLTTLPPEPGDTHPDQRPGAGRLERDRARLETWADTELGLRAA